MIFKNGISGVSSQNSDYENRFLVNTKIKNSKPLLEGSPKSSRRAGLNTLLYDRLAWIFQKFVQKIGLSKMPLHRNCVKLILTNHFLDKIETRNAKWLLECSTEPSRRAGSNALLCDRLALTVQMLFEKYCSLLTCRLNVWALLFNFQRPEIGVPDKCTGKRLYYMFSIAIEYVEMMSICAPAGLLILSL